MSGAPIYLVSACSSGEDFVSAFRRYADRNGVVFVPIASPLPPGKKGRFALTLKDGGVMVEGEAEVVSSAKTPSVLYGRVGMTLKFSEPDEPSKTVLAELEKARLAMKPAPPSVPPRPATIPAEPRPTPPAPGGRVDAVNALAECVVIGDVSALAGDEPPKIPSPKFAIPSIPAMGPGVRPKTPSGPAPVVPAPPAIPKPAVPAPIAPSKSGPTQVGKETVMGMQAITRTPSGGAPVVPVTDTASGRATVAGLQAIGKTPAPATPPVIAASSTPTRDDPTTPMKTPPAGMPTLTAAAAAAAASASSKRDADDLLQTVRGPAPAVDLFKPAPPPKTPTPPAATPVVTRQPTPAQPTPVVPTRVTPAGPVPVPIQVPPPPIIGASAAISSRVTEDADEPTDLTTMPIEPSGPVSVPPEQSGREPRKTVIGIAVVPSGVHVLPATPTGEHAARDTSVMEALSDEPSGPAMITSKPPADVPAPKKAAEAIRAAAVEEHTPSGDWTMTVGEGGPTIEPVPRPEPKKIPPGPPTGDWMIALDPSKPDGWSEPSRIEKRPELPPEQPGPPVSTVASAKDLDSEAKVTPKLKADEAKVEIDPTLMEPLQPLQPIDDFDDEPQLPPPPSTTYPAQSPPQGLPLVAAPSAIIPTPVPQMNPIVPMPMEAAHPPYGAPQLANASGQVPAYELPQYQPTEAIRMPDAAAKKRRTIIIAAAAGGALLLVIILAVVLGGGGGAKQSDEPAPAGSDVVTPTVTPPANTTPPPPNGSGSDEGSAKQAIVQPAVPPDAAAETPAAPDAAVQQVAAQTDCVVELSTAPSGAEIVLDKDVVGTTPAKLQLPCGVESRLTFRKSRFVSAQRAVTPRAQGQKPLRVSLARVTYAVKVSSSPAGATILLGSRSLGITPAVVKLPAFETSTLKIQKDGYAPDMHKVTPKNNSLSISATLKKLPARRPR